MDPNIRSDSARGVPSPDDGVKKDPYAGKVKKEVVDAALGSRRKSASKMGDHKIKDISHSDSEIDKQSGVYIKLFSFMQFNKIDAKPHEGTEVIGEPKPDGPKDS